MYCNLLKIISLCYGEIKETEERNTIFHRKWMIIQKTDDWRLFRITHKPSWMTVSLHQSASKHASHLSYVPFSSSYPPRQEDFHHQSHSQLPLPGSRWEVSCLSSDVTLTAVFRKIKWAYQLISNHSWSMWSKYDIVGVTNIADSPLLFYVIMLITSWF